ncbi:Laccase-5 like [Actinidia chinensis var. chinensis]|uniref:Laccase-5 like n=1 Tax=Actinidia chinensis var. chinensis TaxID=1590841 RepID=A0A2R6RWN5_ACTCC|nr:Laccase-5 like [Actinidia chinensis var. chinensis]
MDALNSIAKPSCFLLLLGLLLLFANATPLLAHAKTHYHDFVVQATKVKRLCKTHNTITVNGMYPGPTLEVNNGDSLVINVVNRARYNVTIHWHGIRQMRTGWADGPEFVTQCPIRPGGSYTYRFTIEGQEGTLWWHAHSSWLRATVYGALIIYPKQGSSYPFPKPNRQTPLLLGEWWDANPIDVVREATRTGASPNVSDAFTINGQPGDLYNCSAKATATAFTTSLRSPKKAEVPTDIDESLFITVGLGLNKCPKGVRKSNCQGPNGTRFTASMNNVSFVLPSNFSLLQAHQQRIPGVFTADFPAKPPVKFDYTGNVSRALWQPIRGTKVHKLKYGARVQVVLQGTSIFVTENHPIHLHGYDFYIVAEGFGNFNPKADSKKFNLIDPPMRNTASVPVGGWTVIRFVADNPGVWLMHCHLDVHITWGLAMAFLVENGVGELQSLQPPPSDLPLC